MRRDSIWRKYRRLSWLYLFTIFSSTVVLAVDLQAAEPDAGPGASAVPDTRIDLTELAAFIRPGFDADWVEPRAIAAVSGAGWRRLPGVDTGERRIRVADMNTPAAVEKFQDGLFADFPYRPALSFSLKKHASREVTILIPFQLATAPDPVRGTGLLVGHVGARWEVYLNGRRLAGRMDPDKNQVVRNLVLLLPTPLLREGDNLLAFRVNGDPVSPYTGFFRNSPYRIGPLEELREIRTDQWQLVLIFIYFFTGLLHLFLYLRRTSEIHYLFFGLFTVCVFFYFSMRHNYVAELIDDFGIVHRVELIALFFLMPLVATFFESILIERVGKMTRFNWVFSLALALLVALPTPLVFARDLMRVWQLNTLLIFIPFYVFYRLGGRLVVEYKALRAGGARAGRIPSALRALFGTVAGNLTLGALVLVGCAIFDILDSIFWALGIRASQFGFLLFVFGIVLILANRFQSIHAKVAALNSDLQKKVADLNRANDQLRESEDQYRRLVDGSTELIFSMDGGGRLRMVNRAFLRQLGHSADAIGEFRARDLLFSGAEDRGMARGLLDQKIAACAAEGRTDHLRLTLQTSRGEPLEVDLRMERIRAGDEPEILCRAVRLSEDALLNYFVSEQQNYRIENFLISAEEVSQRLVRNAARYIDPEELPVFRVAVREIIINAIEHGNLGISYEEKNQALLSDRYQDFVAERQRSPENRDKRVQIDFTLSPEKIACRIADQGAGFDHERMRAKAQAETNTDRQHGRGILITENVFDEVHYNERGNEVLLVKFFTK